MPNRQHWTYYISAKLAQAVPRFRRTRVGNLGKAAAAQVSQDREQRLNDGGNYEWTKHRWRDDYRMRPGRPAAARDQTPA